MRRQTLLVTIVAAFAAVLSAPSPAGTIGSSTLIATMGPTAATTFKTSDGLQIKTLPEGVYLIVVRDRSRTRSFQILGTGPTQVRQSTGRRFVGTLRWRLRLTSGVYRYGSGAQPRGSFRVVTSA